MLYAVFDYDKLVKTMCDVLLVVECLAIVLKLTHQTSG